MADTFNVGMNDPFTKQLEKKLQTSTPEEIQKEAEELYAKGKAEAEAAKAKKDAIDAIPTVEGTGYSAHGAATAKAKAAADPTKENIDNAKKVASVTDSAKPSESPVAAAKQAPTVEEVEPEDNDAGFDEKQQEALTSQASQEAAIDTFVSTTGIEPSGHKPEQTITENNKYAEEHGGVIIKKIVDEDGTVHYEATPNIPSRFEWAKDQGHTSRPYWLLGLTLASVAATVVTAATTDGAFIMPPMDFTTLDPDSVSYGAYKESVEELAKSINQENASAWAKSAQAKTDIGNKEDIVKGAQVDADVKQIFGEQANAMQTALAQALADIHVAEDAKLGDNQVDTIKKTLQAQLEDQYKRLNKVNTLTPEERNNISWLIDAKSGLSTMAEQEQVENAHKTVQNITSGTADILDGIMPF